MPPAANKSCNIPASFRASGKALWRTAAVACPFAALPLLVLPSIRGRLRLGLLFRSARLVYSEEGSLRRGVACFVLAMVKKD